jgi:hypothetical protein
MIEIDYNRKTKEYIISHDDESWTLENLKTHLRSNGHFFEPVSFAVPIEAYSKCEGMAKEISNLFDEKYLFKNFKNR